MISIITPTRGRRGLATLVASARGTLWHPDDEWLIVADTRHEETDWVSGFVSKVGFPLRYAETPGGVSGSSQRNLGISLAREGNYLVWADDDGVFAPGGINTIREHLPRPPAAPHPLQFEIFWSNSPRPLSDPHGFPFDSNWVALGGGQQFVTPNLPGKVGTWPDSGSCDYNFIRETLDLWGGFHVVKQVPEVIGHAY